MTPRAPTRLLLAFFLIALPLAGCGGSDPKSLNDEAYASLHRGDARAALADFERALEAAPPGTIEHLRAALGRCEALAQTDPSRAQAEFLGFASRERALVREDDYSLMCAALVRARAFSPAIDVMDAGMKAFPESKRMQDTKDSVIRATQQAEDPAALNKLASLGYVGRGK
jgi:hypothetical protein